MQGVPLQTFLQALQPTQFLFTGNPFMAPQYPAMGPMMPQPPPMAQVPALADHPLFGPLVAAVSEKVMKDIKKQDAPADMSPENEEILVSALKKGGENQWPMDRIFQELGQKHGYTKNVWMEWFTLNVRKLYPKLASNPEANSAQAARGDEAGGSGEGPSASQIESSQRTVSSNRTASTFRFVQEQSHPRARKVVITTPKPPVGSTHAKSTTSASERRAGPPPGSGSSTNSTSTRTPSTNRPPASSQSTFSAPTPYSANRSKRGASVLPTVHDQTLIPWTDGSTKPSPPTRLEASAKLPLPRRASASPATSAGGDSGNGKLTDDEKIFFVHWLRWRLREGSLPEKETLFEELEDEVPHRAAETWRRHWGAHCEVPDGIYIEARKRVERERAQRFSQSPVAVARGEHSDGSESDDDYDDGDALVRKPSKPAATVPTTTTPATTSSSASTAPPTMKNRKPGPMSRPSGGLPVTDEDLRAMARYRFAMGGDWDRQRFKTPRWYEFADRPENRKRSREAWYSITRDPKHAAVIEQYVKELEQTQAVSALAAPRRSKPGLPPSGPQQTQPVASTSSAGVRAKQASDSSKPTALKRPAAADPGARDNARGDGDGAGKSKSAVPQAPPPSKRQKMSMSASWDMGPADVVDLTVDSERED